MNRLLLFSLLPVSVLLCAATYEWTDSRGTVNFTEDLGKVPPKYRKKVKVIGEESGTPQITETTEITDPPKVTPKAVEKVGEKKSLYGGKDEKGWRSEFIQAKGELKLAEQDLDAFRGRLKDTSRMSRTEYLSLSNSLKNQEYLVNQLRKRLDALNASADQAGVPAEYRQ